MKRRHISLLFRRELLDLRRERTVFRSLFLQPLIFALALAGPMYVFYRLDVRNRGETMTVAVQGDVDAVPGLRDAVEQPPFELRRTDDAAQTLTSEKAVMGIEIPPDAARLVESGRPVPLRVLSFSTQDVSSRAIPALTRRLAELRRAESARLLEAAGASSALAAPLRMEIVDVATTSSEGVRFGLAQGLPGLVVLQLFGLVSIAATRLVGAKERRTLESLLVLPLDRRDLLVGIGSAALAIGAVSAVIVLVPITLLVSAAAAGASRSLGGPIDVAVSIGVGTLAMAVALVATGLYTGARSGSGSEGSAVASIVQIAMITTVMFSPFLSEVEAETQLLVLPLLGPMLFIRDGVADGPTLASAVTVLGSQVALALLVIRGAARVLESERGVLRATR